MPRREYQSQLEDLRADVVAMSDLVLSRYADALETMATGDLDLARRVVDGDREVNRRYLALEGDCIDLFALQQPVASDLRFVASSFKILTDLERVGDLAANLAEYEGHTGADRYGAVDVLDVADFAGEMVRDAMRAYETGNPTACREVAARDGTLDDRCARAAETVFTDLLGAGAGIADGPSDTSGDADGTAKRDTADGTADRAANDTADVDVDAVTDDATRLLLVLRDVERVGDHAVNVCARTLYATENDTELIY